MPSSVIKALGLVFFVAAGFWMFRYTDLSQYLNPDALQAYIQSYGVIAPAVYVFFYCIGPVLFVPGAILSVAGGLAFGVLWGTILTILGATIGATLAFIVARYLGREFVERWMKGRLKALDDAAEHHGFKVILFLRLVPLVPFNALDYAAGLSKISVRDYVLGTFIGIIPGTFVYVYLGSTLVDILSWQFFSAVAMLAVLSLTPFVYKKWKRSGPVTLGVTVVVLGFGVLSWGLAQGSVDSSGYVIDTFSDGLDASGLPRGWKSLLFKKIERHTLYTIEKMDDNDVLKAQSRASASGIYRDLGLDLKEHPILSWRWRVENIIQKGDEHTKAGDDYAARIYVTFRFEPGRASLWEKTKYETYRFLYGEYPPGASINYIWANKLKQGTVIDSAYTDRSKMVAVESGSEGIGEWRTERRNVYQDYKELFGDEPPAPLAIAIMTDTDNTGEAATAYYDDIVFMKEEAFQK
jgi:uncharacterized membrane protein YdjX (TVP38/TMEM64 family)